MKTVAAPPPNQSNDNVILKTKKLGIDCQDLLS